MLFSRLPFHSTTTTTTVKPVFKKVVPNGSSGWMLESYAHNSLISPSFTFAARLFDNAVTVSNFFIFADSISGEIDACSFILTEKTKKTRFVNIRYIWFETHTAAISNFFFSFCYRYVGEFSFGINEEDMIVFVSSENVAVINSPVIFWCDKQFSREIENQALQQHRPWRYFYFANYLNWFWMQTEICITLKLRPSTNQTTISFCLFNIAIKSTPDSEKDSLGDTLDGNLK